MSNLHYRDTNGNWVFFTSSDEVAVQDSEPPDHPAIWIDVDAEAPPVDGGGGGGVTDHGALSGLADDDHPHYLTQARGDALYAPIGGGGGVSDHGALTGLADDDHPQYLTQARGDALYATTAYVDARIWYGTQAEYDAIANKLVDVLYVVVG